MVILFTFLLVKSFFFSKCIHSGKRLMRTPSLVHRPVCGGDWKRFLKLGDFATAKYTGKDHPVLSYIKNEGMGFHYKNEIWGADFESLTNNKLEVSIGEWNPHQSECCRTTAWAAHRQGRVLQLLMGTNPPLMGWVCHRTRDLLGGVPYPRLIHIFIGRDKRTTNDSVIWGIWRWDAIHTTCFKFFLILFFNFFLRFLTSKMFFMIEGWLLVDHVLCENLKLMISKIWHLSAFQIFWVLWIHYPPSPVSSCCSLLYILFI